METAKAGDIIEFEKPLYYWHKKDLEQGAKYIVVQHHKSTFHKDKDGWWHCIELPELDDPKVLFEFQNGCEEIGYLKDFPHYKIVGKYEGKRNVN